MNNVFLDKRPKSYEILLTKQTFGSPDVVRVEVAIKEMLLCNPDGGLRLSFGSERARATLLVPKVIDKVTRHPRCSVVAASKICPIRESRDLLIGGRGNGLLRKRLVALIEIGAHNGVSRAKSPKIC